MSLTNIDLLYYHSPCQDGAASCYSALLFFPDAKCVGIPAGSSVDLTPFDKSVTKSLTLCFADVCPPVDNLKDLSEYFDKIYVFDHHDTSKSYSTKLEDCKNIYFYHDLTKSGCTITFDVIKEELKSDIQRPWFLEYIEDRDIWQHKLPNTKEINSALFSEFCKFQKNQSIQSDYSTVIKLFFDTLKSKDVVDELITIGKQNLAFEQQKIQKSVDEAVVVQFKFKNESNDFDYKCWKYDCEASLRSDVGNVLTKKSILLNDTITHPAFAVCWRDSPSKEEFYVSMRGSDNSPNLALIASCFCQGGGHEKAAGFTIRTKLTGFQDKINHPNDIFIELK